MPNLFSDLPVAILAWVPASTSGLTRTEIRAVRAGLDRKPRQQFEFGLGFDVDAENVGGQRRAQFGFGLADAGKQDLVRRNAGRQRPLQLAAGHHVGAGAELGQRAQHRLVGIGLHGVADQRLLAGEGLGEDAVVALQRRGRIAIERRADRVRQIGQIDRLGVQHAVAIVEVIHGEGSVTSSGSRMNGFLRPLGAVGRRIHAVGRIEHAGRRGPLGLEAAACAEAFGGRSRPALRPQPPSASAVTPSRMMAHPDDVGR